MLSELLLTIMSMVYGCRELSLSKTDTSWLLTVDGKTVEIDNGILPELADQETWERNSQSVLQIIGTLKSQSTLPT